MKINDFKDMHCAIADVFGAIGDKWAILILHDLFFGKTKYSELSKSSNITHATLSSRLKHLENEGIIIKQLYQKSPSRYEYHLTEKGKDLALLLVAASQIGQKWGRDVGSIFPYHLENKHTGNAVILNLIDEISGENIMIEDLIPKLTTHI